MEIKIRKTESRFMKNEITRPTMFYHTILSLACLTIPYRMTKLTHEYQWPRHNGIIIFSNKETGLSRIEFTRKKKKMKKKIPNKVTIMIIIKQCVVRQQRMPKLTTHTGET